MPRISEFFGITIWMYFHDHAPPHFHARYAEHEAVIAIASLEILEGELPRRALSLVLEWAVLHRAALHGNFQRVQSGTHPFPIDPLP